MDSMVKTFRGYIFEDIRRLASYKWASKAPFHQINSIIIPSAECLKIFMVKILRIEQNLAKTSKFSPLEINPLYGNAIIIIVR